MKYAGFWQRLGAAIIDSIILAVPTLPLMWLSQQSKVLHLLLTVPLAFTTWGYTYYYHSRTGQTIGKGYMDIRVVNLDGSGISCKTAFKRGAVELAFITISTIGTLWGISQIPAMEFTSLTWLSITAEINKSQPNIIKWIGYGEAIWAWSELFTVLFNNKRRALHDLIAGTVVIDTRSSLEMAPFASTRTQQHKT